MPRKPRKNSDADSDPNDDYCFKCDLEGDLICCETCPRVYHLYCLDPPLKKVPKDEWYCPRCEKKRNSTPLLPKKRKAPSAAQQTKQRKSDGKKTLAKKRSLSALTQKNSSSPASSELEVVELSDDSESDEENEKRRERLKRAAKAARKKAGSKAAKASSSSSSAVSTPSAKSPQVDRASSSEKRAKRGSTESRGAASPTRSTPKSARRKEGKGSSSSSSRRSTRSISSEAPSQEEETKRTTRSSAVVESDEDDEDPMVVDLYNFDADTLEDEDEEDEDEEQSDGSVADHEGNDDNDETDEDEEMEEASDSDLVEVEPSVIGSSDDEDDDNEHEDDRQMDGLGLFWKKSTQAVREEWFPVQRDDAGETVEHILTWNNHLFYPSQGKSKISSEDSRAYCKSPRNFYLVKWQGSSYRRCTWVRRFMLEKVASQKLRNFEKQREPCSTQKPAEKIFKAQYLLPDRVIAHSSQGYLVKWRGLEYSECTWEHRDELDDDVECLEAFERREDHTVSLQGHSKKAPKKFLTSPSYLQGTLHDYQLEGLNWLLYSWRKRTNVILADEMGLGKTIQTIAFLSSLFEHCNRGPYLIVVPLSTLRNWEREFAFWAPQLNVITYIGTRESREVIRKHEFFFKPFHDRKGCRRSRHVKFNVLLCTYTMIINDSNVLSRFPWKCLVVDEAQRLKNQQSKLFQVLTQFKSEFRLLLTGTPLQNNLKELFVLLNFLSSKDFDDFADFEETFENVTKEDQVKRLHALLAPHILRRLKSDVLKHMPSKAEFIVRVDMTRSQKELYKAILTKNYKVLRAGGKAQRVSLNNVLMELQKCCNHPFLVNGLEDPTASAEQNMKRLIKGSGKLDLLDKMLRQLKENGHRVLIFSQMTRLLDILEDFLVYRGYAFGRIDGNVTGKDRQERIDAFNTEGSTQFCFLLSTRAGGLGINLATADTVIIYDSDWNPHNDIQAFSRAHRIGQKNRVMIYRLVTRHGVEERILQTAKEKMMLEHIVVKKLDSKSKLSQSEMDDILRFGTEKLFSAEDDEGKIVYDDAAVVKLLDRTREAAIEQESDDTSAADDYLKSFKVAHYDVADEDIQMEEVEVNPKSAAEVDSSNFWDNVLEADYNQLHQEEEEEEEELGKGKRARPDVTYYGFQPFLVEPEAGGDSRQQKLEKVHQVRVSGSGATAKVYGFAPNHRSFVQKFFFKYGYTDALIKKCLSHRWLHQKPPEVVVNLASAIFEHIVEPPNDKDTYADGAPKLSAELHSKKQLQRMIVVQLIHGKVEEVQKTGEFFIRGASWSLLATEHRGWGKTQDLHLLQGIVKHGYGSWREILIDMEWTLLPRLMLHLNLTLPDYCKFVLNSAEEIAKNSAGSSGVREATALEEEEEASLLAEFKSHKSVTTGLLARLVALERALIVEYQLTGGLLTEQPPAGTDSAELRGLRQAYEQCRAMGELFASRPASLDRNDERFKSAYQDQLKSFYFNLRSLKSSLDLKEQ